MPLAYFVVRATVPDAAKRKAFDEWYSREHLPDAAKAFGVNKAWRFWSVTDPSLHEAMYEFADPSYPTSIRQPILIVAAGRDELVSTPAIGQFAVRLRAGSHLVIAGARHELLMEQDRFRSQFWAAFDAFVPGSPLFG